MSNLTSPYWTPPAEYLFEKQMGQNYRENDLGFRYTIPVHEPVTIGANYYGSNEGVLGMPDKIVYDTRGEYFAPGGYIPMTGGIPMINVYDPMYQFKRSDHVQYV